MKTITIKNTEYSIRTEMSEVDLSDIQSGATDMIGDLSYNLACDIAKLVNGKVEQDCDNDANFMEAFLVRKN